MIAFLWSVFGAVPGFQKARNIARWVDAPNYVGACRRLGASGFRLFDRRRRDDSQATPKTESLIRQLAVTAHGFMSARDRVRVILKLQATAKLASARGEFDCAADLTRILRTVTNPSADPAQSADKALAEIPAVLLSLPPPAPLRVADTEKFPEIEPRRASK